MRAAVAAIPNDATRTALAAYIAGLQRPAGSAGAGVSPAGAAAGVAAAGAMEAGAGAIMEAGAFITADVLGTTVVVVDFMADTAVVDIVAADTVAADVKLVCA